MDCPYSRYGQQSRAAHRRQRLHHYDYRLAIATQPLAPLSTIRSPPRALNQPRGLYVDRSLNVYIADTNNHRIRKFSVSDSVLTTFAGSKNAGFSETATCRAMRIWPSRPPWLWIPLAPPISPIALTIAYGALIRRAISQPYPVWTAPHGGDAGPANRAALSAPHGLLTRRHALCYRPEQSPAPENSARQQHGPARQHDAGTGPRSTAHAHCACRAICQTTVKGLTFTLSDSIDANRISSDDFSEFRLYESYDAALGGDLLLGQLDARELLGDQTTVYATTLATPRANTDRYYILAGLLSKTSTQGTPCASPPKPARRHKRRRTRCTHTGKR